MGSPEYGIGEDEEEVSDLESLNNEIALLENECGHVLDDPDNAEALDQIIRDAREFYAVDNSGWQNLVRATREKLLREDEPGVIRDILREAMTKATTELM